MSSNKHNVALDRVRDIRSEREMSQAELAKRTGINQTTVSYIERKGKGTLEQAENIARALSVRIAELSWAGYKSLQGSTVRAGSSYVYEPEVEVQDTEVDQPTDVLVRDPVVDHEVEPGTVTHRFEISEPVLDRIDRVLGIVENFVYSRR